MPYRATDDTADSSAFTTTRKRRVLDQVTVVAALTLMGIGTVYAVRGSAPYFLVGLLPLALRLMLVSCVRLGRLWRLHLARPTPAAVAGEGVIALRGRVVAGAPGAFVLPVSRQRAVWAQVEADGDDNGADSPRPTIANVTAARGFCIEDGSGECAYVEIARAKVIRSSLAFTATQTITAGLDAFCRAHRRKDGLIVAVGEWALRLDDEVIVVGNARRAQDSDATPAGRLILGSEAALLVSRLPLPSSMPQLAWILVSLVLAGFALFPFIFAAWR
jgi:hypothetical protein